MSEEQKDSTLPDRRRNSYEDLSARLDKAIAQIEHRFTKRYRGMLVAFTTIGLTSFLAIGGYGLLLRKLADTRVDFIRTTCVATNQRHDKTVAYLNALINKAKKKAKSAEEKAQLETNRKENDKLIGLLSPKQNCQELAKVASGQKQPPPPSGSPEGGS